VDVHGGDPGPSPDRLERNLPTDSASGPGNHQDFTGNVHPNLLLQ
jgi:hypothetical protein